MIAALVAGGEAEGKVEIEGERDVLLHLRAMVDLPPRLREEVEALAAVGAAVAS